MSTIPGPNASRVESTIKVLWMIWAGTLGALGMIYLALGRGALAPAGNLAVNLIGFVPLFVSIVLRWLALPRSGMPPGRLLVMFVVGIALADACGIFGIILGGPYRQDLFVLGLLGVGQWVPLFARRVMEPQPAGFIPNN
jgi:hypothetical protein